MCASLPKTEKNKQKLTEEDNTRDTRGVDGRQYTNNKRAKRDYRTETLQHQSELGAATRVRVCLW